MNHAPFPSLLDPSRNLIALDILLPIIIGVLPRSMQMLWSIWEMERTGNGLAAVPLAMGDLVDLVSNIDT